MDWFSQQIRASEKIQLTLMRKTEIQEILFKNNIASISNLARRPVVMYVLYQDHQALSGLA